MSLSEKIQEINREISATVERMLTDLRQDVAQRLRTSSEEIARHVEELTPALPSSFVAHEDLSPFAEEMARQAAEQASREAREAAEQASREAAKAADIASRAAARGAVVEVRDALAAIDRARSQAEILAALLREVTGRFADRAAVVLVRGGEMRGWAGQGFGEADGAIRELTFSPAGGGWAALAQAQSALLLSAGDAAELCSRIEAPLPHEGVLLPIVLRDRVAAGLYADRLSGLPAIEALQVLAHLAAQAIELLPFRERAFTPTLAVDSGLAAPVAEPAAAQTDRTDRTDDQTDRSDPTDPTDSTTASTTDAAPAPSLEDTQSSAADPAADPAEVLGEVDEIEVEAEPEPVAEAPAPWETPAEALAGLPAAPATPEIPEATPEASPAATVYQPIPREALRAVGEPEPATGRMTSPIPMPQLDQVNPDETVLMQRPGLREVPAETPAPPPPAPLRPVPAPAPAPEPAATVSNLSGIPEVKPPSGVDGPGWAFATSRVAVSPTEDARHEEARRLARLLVSEIKLYNEEQVEEGRRRKDVYERLKEDIDRSRQMYEERVEPSILKTTDYFYQELVRILAAGDPKALGI
jgi:hypothetical protein